jgi:putative SOS response-associated peptidase YedK
MPTHPGLGFRRIGPAFLAFGQFRDPLLNPESHRGGRTRFTKTGEDWFCFAGLWRPMPEGQGAAFTLLTTDPGPDVAPIHNRQMAILERADWSAWLDLTRPEAELLQPLPAGRLTVEQVRP